MEGEAPKPSDLPMTRDVSAPTPPPARTQHKKLKLVYGARAGHHGTMISSNAVMELVPLFRQMTASVGPTSRSRLKS